MERAAAPSDDEMVEARVDFVMKGVDDNATCAYSLVHQAAAFSRIDIADVHVYWRWRLDMPDHDEVIDFGGTVANEIWHTMPSDFEHVAWRHAPPIGKPQPNGAGVIFEYKAIYGNP